MKKKYKHKHKHIMRGEWIEAKDGKGVFIAVCSKCHKQQWVKFEVGSILGVTIIKSSPPDNE